MTSFWMNVVTVIAHTPIWVWPLYVLLLFLGLQRTRESTVALWRVLMLPLIVALLATWTFVGTGGSGWPVVLLGLFVGGTAGWRFEPAGATRRMPNGALWMGGEWWTFAQIALVLIVRYTTSIVAGIDPILNADPAWHFGALFVSTTLSAVFLGRTAARLKLYFAPSAVTATTIAGT